MAGNAGYFNKLQQRIKNLSIGARISIGNALVIIIGAIAGTLITRYFAAQTSDMWLILIFALSGITISIIINTFIVRAALRPLVSLRTFVERIQDKQTIPPLEIPSYGDPGINELAVTLDSLVRQLDESNHQLRIISQQAISAQEDERKRIARSLHDDTAQALSTLIINLERIEQRSPADAENLKVKLNEIRLLAMDILDSLRKVVLGLRPAILDDLGLAPAIRWYARSNLEDAGIQVEVDVPEEEISLPSELKISLFRITQEAINNIRRHSGARKAEISFLLNSEKVCLRIEDDGHGFKTAQDQGEALRLHQWGLVGIQERVDLIGGYLVISSDENKGTSIQVTAPLPIVNNSAYG